MIVEGISTRWEDQQAGFPCSFGRAGGYDAGLAVNGETVLSIDGEIARGIVEGDALHSTTALLTSFGIRTSNVISLLTLKWGEHDIWRGPQLPAACMITAYGALRARPHCSLNGVLATRCFTCPLPSNDARKAFFTRWGVAEIGQLVDIAHSLFCMLYYLHELVLFFALHRAFLHFWLRNKSFWLSFLAECCGSSDVNLAFMLVRIRFGSLCFDFWTALGEFWNEWNCSCQEVTRFPLSRSQQLIRIYACMFLTRPTQQCPPLLRRWWAYTELFWRDVFLFNATMFYLFIHLMYVVIHAKTRSEYKQKIGGYN